MIGARIKQLGPDQIYKMAEALRAAGGRVQFAYAWSPGVDDREVRYVSAIPEQTDFEMWTVAARELPSLAPVWPLLGWYEREMMDLQGVKFTGHPEPYPLILRDGDSTHINGRSPNSLLPTNGHPHLPAIETRDVQQLHSARFGPMCWNPLNLRSSTSASTSFIISLGCSSSTAVWKRASRECGRITPS